MSEQYCKAYIEQTFKELINQYNSNLQSNFQSYDVQIDLYNRIVSLTRIGCCPSWIKAEVFHIKHPKDEFWISF